MANFKIFNDVFDFKTQITIFEYLKKVPYFLGWSDRPDKNSLLYLHTNLNRQSMSEIGFFNNIKNQDLIDFVKDKTPFRVVVNASYPGYFYYPHLHNEYALVYYANLEWEEHWAGETIIYEENGKDIRACLPYTPGRVVLIDKNVPHALRPPTFQAPFYRFTISIFYQ